MKLSYDLGFLAIRVAIATYDAITFFIYLGVSLYQELLKKSLKGV